MDHLQQYFSMFIQQQYINLRQNSHLREFLIIKGERYAEIAVGYLYSHYLQPPPIASIHHICSITTKFHILLLQ